MGEQISAAGIPTGFLERTCGTPGARDEQTCANLSRHSMVPNAHSNAERAVERGTQVPLRMISAAPSGMGAPELPA